MVAERTDNLISKRLIRAFAFGEMAGFFICLFLVLNLFIATNIFAETSCLESADGSYSSCSPHWRHINILDLGREIKYLSQPLRQQAYEWYASHIDIKEVGMTTPFYFFIDGSWAQESNIIKGLNPTFKTFGYDFDSSMCLHLYCNYNFPDNTQQINLPEDYYLHFSTPVTLEYYDFSGTKIKTEEIPGCSVNSSPEELKRCRVKTFAWQDYRYLANVGNANWQQWYADQLIQALSDHLDGRLVSRYDLDGLFLDEHGPGFSAETNWGYRVKVASGQPEDAGGILEYGGLVPRDVMKWMRLYFCNGAWSYFNCLDYAYNADMVNWLGYLRSILAARGKFAMVNTAESAAVADLSRNQALAAGGVLTELLNIPEFTGGCDAYQQFIDFTAELARKEGAVGDLYGNPCSYGPSDSTSSDDYLGDDDPTTDYLPGNYATAKERYIMWKLASYYVLKEPPGSPGKVYFDPNLCIQDNSLNFLNDWLEAFEVDVGLPVEDSQHQNKGFVYQSGPITCIGTDGYPQNVDYKIFARRYSNNVLVLVRPRDNWYCTDYSDRQAKTVQLDTQMVMLKGDGTFSSPLNEIKIRNGEAAILFGPPVLDSLGNKIINEGERLAFTVEASGREINSLSLIANNLPEGATFTDNHDGTGLLSWAPNYAQAGEYNGISFTAKDVGLNLSVSENIAITVNNINRAPVLSAIGDKSVATGELLTFTLSAADPDGDSLTYSASGLPSGATFNNQTHTFSWTPSFAQAGSYTITFSVSDGRLSDTKSATITVNNVNRPPVLNAIGDKTGEEGTLLSFSVIASDPDTDKLSLSATNLPAGATVTDNHNGTGTFSWLPDFNQAGAYPIVYFEVSDGQLTDQQGITVTVLNTNRAPTIEPISDQTIAEGELLSFSVITADPDQVNLTHIDNYLSISTSNLPNGATFIDNHDGTGAFNWTPGYDQAGQYPMVHFEVSDGALTGHQDITITVLNTNRAPSLSPIETKTVNEGDALTFVVSASDSDGDSLTYSAINLPSGASLDSNTGVFSWTPTTEQAGSYTVQFTVSDGALSASQQIIITVNTIPDPEPIPIGPPDPPEPEPIAITPPQPPQPIAILPPSPEPVILPPQEPTPALTQPTVNPPTRQTRHLGINKGNENKKPAIEQTQLKANELSEFISAASPDENNLMHIVINPSLDIPSEEINSASELSPFRDKKLKIITDNKNINTKEEVSNDAKEKTPTSLANVSQDKKAEGKSKQSIKAPDKFSFKKIIEKILSFLAAKFTFLPR